MIFDQNSVPQLKDFLALFRNKPNFSSRETSSMAFCCSRYEVIKEYYKKGFPKSRIDEFYSSGEYDHYSDIFFDGSAPSLMYRAWAWAMMR